MQTSDTFGVRQYTRNEYDHLSRRVTKHIDVWDAAAETWTAAETAIMDTSMRVNKLKLAALIPSSSLLFMGILSISGVHFPYDQQMVIYVFLSGAIGFLLINPLAKCIEGCLFKSWIGMSYQDAFLAAVSQDDSIIQHKVESATLFWISHSP